MGTLNPRILLRVSATVPWRSFSDFPTGQSKYLVQDMR